MRLISPPVTVSSTDQRYQIGLAAFVAIPGNIIWQVGKIPLYDEHEEEGLLVQFDAALHAKLRSTLPYVRKILEKNEVYWLYEDGGRWTIDLDGLFAAFPDLKPHAWLKGKVRPLIEIDTVEHDHFGKKRTESHLHFRVTHKEMLMSAPTKIFLSHKGIDKPIVREYFSVLRTLGFEPWLDEDALLAGNQLERALLQGMLESCAAVFFIKPSYRDENYLATEINYAMAEKRKKGEQFSIITLVLPGEDHAQTVIPDLLQQFVWKEPATHLKALEEIIRALPIAPQEVGWKQT